MKIWRVLCGERNMQIEMEPYKSFSYLMDNSGLLIDEWIKCYIEITKKGKNNDFPELGGGIIVFNQNTIEILDNLLLNNVQLLDVDVINSDIQLKVVHVFNQEDAVDYTRSIPQRTLGGIVNGFKKLAFREEIVASRTIFKIPELSVSVFVSDSFRDKVMQSKLKGFDFIEVWDSEVTEEMELAAQEHYNTFLAEIENNKGPEMTWSEAVAYIQQGKAIASGHWKMQQDKNGEMQIARLSLDCQYNWSSSPIIPSVLLGLNWHEVEKSDL
jgi:hypothetical protein